MSVLTRTALYPNQRWDTPDARMIEAASLNDWRYFLSGSFTETSKIITGFDITNYSTIFTTPGLKIKLSNVCLYHTEATTQAAGFYVSAGTEADENVTLSPSSTNFIELDFSVVSNTPDVRAFWDQGANSGQGAEYTDTVNTVINLKLTITTNISGFTTGKIPLYKCTTDGTGIILSITDSRPLFFRLGTGGASPDPNNDFGWHNLPDASHARFETPSTSTSYSAGNAPWQGGDKNIRNLKEWMDATMTSIKELKGTPYWYMPVISGGVTGAYQNAVMTVFTGGTWQHIASPTPSGHLALLGGSTLYRLGFSNNVTFSAFADIDLITNTTLFIILPQTDTAVSYGMGDNTTSPVVPQNASIITPTSINVALGGNFISGGGKILVHGQTFTYTSFTSGTGLFSGVSPDPSGIVGIGDTVYQSDLGGVGYYHTSTSDLVPGTIGIVSEGAERTKWLAMYDGINTIVLGNGDLEQGEEMQVGDETSLNLLSYIGAPDEASSNPTYSLTASGAKTGQTNYNATASENLTARLSKITSMMADKAQDKTIRLLGDSVSEVVNTTNGLNQDITFTGASPILRILMPSSTNNGSITLSGTLSLAANEIAYFQVDRNAALTIPNLPTLTISSAGSVTLDENTYVFAVRLSSTSIYLWDGRIVAVGAFPLNQDISTSVRTKIGILNETSYEAYSSTSVIASGDSSPAAISKLDAAVSSILTDSAKEEFSVVGVGGTTTFTTSTFTWDISNSVYDIQVYVNGRKQQQDPTGGLLEDYRKTADDTIEFSYTVPEYARITVREERTGGGGGGGGTDLTNITVDPQPSVSGGRTLGSTTKGWNGLKLKDTTSAQVYEINIIAGVLTITPVP